MSGISTFDFNEIPVRVLLGADGEPWWVAADVCRVLEISNSRDANSELDEDERSQVNWNTVGSSDGIIRRAGNPNVSVISESGLYALVFKSRKDEARTFRKWITKEVLPSLRKTGRYAVGEGFESRMPALAGIGDSGRLEAVQVVLFQVMAQFMTGQASTRRLNAATKWAARVHEGMDRKWKQEDRAAIKEKEQEDILCLIDSMLWPDGTGAAWEGRAADLERLLCDSGASTRDAARKVLTYSSAMGHALMRVQQVAPERVSRRVLRGYTLWKISSPAGEVTSEAMAS